MRRDYDPQTGRYVQSDPVGIGGGIGTYSYVDDLPTQLIDPDGLTGYASPEGKDPRNGWVECNGRNGVVVKMPVLTSAENGCGLGDCVRAHELVHIMDLRRLDANVCRVQLAKVIPRFDTQAQHNASEDRAYDESARCLKNKLQLPCTTDECKKAIQTWIDWLPTARIQSKTGAHP